MGVRQEQLSQLYERRVVRTAGVIVDDNSHVLAKHYELLPSGRRFRLPKSNAVCSQLHLIIITMIICKAPTLRPKAVNKHTHIVYIEMENVIKKISTRVSKHYARD